MEKRKKLKSKESLSTGAKIVQRHPQKRKKKAVSASSGRDSKLEMKHSQPKPAIAIKKKKKTSSVSPSVKASGKRTRRKSKKVTKTSVVAPLKEKIKDYRKKLNRIKKSKRKSSQLAHKKPHRGNGTGKTSKKKKELLIEIGLSLIILSVILAIISGFTFRLVKVEGYAMSPRINDQEVVVVNKLSDFERFDFIYFTAPTTGTEMVRRVIGMPGEEIFYRDEILYVNDREVPERFLDLSTYLAGGQVWTEDFNVSELLGAGLTRIPEGYYFVLGENRPYAADSRLFGLVPEENIVGKVTMRLLPLRSMSRFI